MKDTKLNILVDRGVWVKLQQHLSEMPYKDIKPLENLFEQMEVSEQEDE